MIRGLEFRRQLEIAVDGRRVLAEPIGGAEDIRRHAAEPDGRRGRRRSAAAGARAAHRRAARHRRRVRRPAPRSRTRGGCSRSCASTSDTSETLIGPPLVADRYRHRAVQRHRPRRHAQPARASSRAGPRPPRRRSGVRPHHPVDAGAPGVSRHADHRGRRRADGASSGNGDATPASTRPSGSRCSGFWPGPKFLVRTERVPASRPGTVYRVTDVELASRLSFFLWSSMPDDELLRARRRRAGCARPATLEQQVRRMLADPRAPALVENFAGQWLQLRNLRSALPDSREFPDFDDQLRQAFRRETELLFDSILREDRSVLDLLTADYTFVNERLAKHYGIPHIYGSHFRRVPVTVDARRGVLGHGSILTVTSHADRTSPVRPRQVDPRQPARHAAAAAAARRAGAARAIGPGAADDDARADGAAPGEPAVRQLPQGDGPARLRARELRRGRRVARTRRAGADRRQRRLRRTGRASTGRRRYGRRSWRSPRFWSAT